MAHPYKYDYLIVGAGLFGSVVAYRLHERGLRVKVIDRRSAVGGNVRCERVDGIDVHCYGPHIFHTSNREVWDFVCSKVEMRPFINTPVANFHGREYSLPFNMNTFRQLWGDVTPDEARQIIERQRRESGITEPRNLEEQAIAMVGRDIYETLVKGYTEKQWGRQCKELPPEIIRRLPVRFTADNNYFNDTWQGIPVGGYNALVDSLLQGVEVETNCDFFASREALSAEAEKIVYTGEIDRFYDYCFGRLEYRTLRFEHERLEVSQYQRVAVVNYTDSETPFTRIVEHKHFSGVECDHTIITREYPSEWSEGAEPYYPIGNDHNKKIYEQYKALADKEMRVIFGGRLAEYRYYDMHHVVERALSIELK